MGGRGTGARAPLPGRRGPAAGATGTHRLVGLDMARGTALIAMMTTHILPTFQQDPTTLLWSATWVGTSLSGRAAALFAVLAGVSLTLGRVPAARNRLGLALRAGVIAVVGLTLGLVEVNVAVILVHYALLFWCALPVVGLGRRALGLLAGAWILLSPVVAFLVRPVLLSPGPSPHLAHNPTWEDLGDPGRLLADLMVTGYYPVFQWFAYLLVGLWIGRAPLTRASTQVGLLVGGAAVAVAAKTAAWSFLVPLGGINALMTTDQAAIWPLRAMLEANLSGVDQVGTWWWLTTAAPHSGTPLDLLHTSGTSAAAVGAFLLVARVAPLMRTGFLAPLAGAGAMTLTLYSLHVWALSWPAVQDAGLEREPLLAVHVAAALALGLLVQANGWRGPLEALAHRAARLGLAAGRTTARGRPRGTPPGRSG
ncbi:heparan-alpha-glucosaminide N-acetyltransferase domain-containing protein [Sinomonas sp. B1-1]|uniref:heparan-alpha-glucosaminide N-acetyltransferase domain-containing protein n=1 Tax=Sinomonas sp. B1-1 TaxID=3141454 RepID=UPI003D2A130B